MSENINEVRKALEKIINSKDSDNSSDEHFLGSHYNEMLKFEELISKIHLSQHYRILEIALRHENEIPINYEELISFIVSQLINNEDFNVLLPLIDINKLKRTDLLKITKCPNFRESILNIPKYYIIESIEKEHKQTSDVINEIKNEIESISKKNDENINSIKVEISNLFNQFVRESISQINLSINNNINQSKTDILNTIKEVSTLVGNQGNSIINSINDQVGKQIVNVHNNINSTYNKINERINSVHKNIDDTYSKIDEIINTVHKNINEKSESNENNINEKFGTCNENIGNKFNSLVNEINEIKAKLLSTSSKFENNSISIKTEIKNIKDQLKQNDNINIKLDSNLKDIKINLQQNADNSNNLKSNLNDIKEQLKQNSNNNSNLKSDLNDFKNQLSSKINDSKSSLNTEINLSKNLLISFLKENIRIIYDLFFFRENLPITFNFDTTKKPCFDGLFNYCFQKIGNPFKNKIFEVTGNPEIGYENVLYEIFDNNNDRNYKSKDENDSYIQIDFKDRRFCFKAIEIYNHSQNGNTIKKLTMEGSKTGSTWESIDSWNNFDKCLPGPYSSCHALAYYPSSSYYRFLKIKINGPNTSGNYRLCLKKIELYGILK